MLLANHLSLKTKFVPEGTKSAVLDKPSMELDCLL